MNGATIISSPSPTYKGSVASPDSAWTVAGIGDFSSNGKADIVRRQSTTGALAEWQMDGATISSSSPLPSQGNVVAPDLSWSVAAVGDFAGNGTSDILWRQASNGSLAMWLMNGAIVESSAAVTYQGSAVKPDSTWSIIDVGDFNGGANASDILWQQSSTGALVEWQMNAAQIVSSQTVTSQGDAAAPNAAWQPQGKPTDVA